MSSKSPAGQTAFHIINNTLAFLAGDVTAQFLRFIAALWIVRSLTGEAYGQFSFVYVYLSFYEVFVHFGLNATLIREVAQAPDQEPRILGNAVLFRTLLCLAIWPVVFGVIKLLNYPVPLQGGVLLASFQLFLSLRDVYDVVYKVRLKMVYPALWNALKTLLSLGLVVIVACLRPSIYNFILAYLLSGVVALLGFMIFTRRFVRFDFRPDFPLMARLIRQSLPLLLSGYLTLIYYRIDVMMLSKMRTFLEVGYYSVAVRLTEALGMIASSLYVSLFPLLAGSFRKNRPDFEKAVSQGFRSLSLLGFPIAVGGTVLASELIVFLFGTEYLPAAPTLKILLWYTFFYFFGGLLANILIACGKQAVDAWVSLILVGLNISLNLVLIPVYSYNGAALSTVIVEISGVILIMIYAVKNSEIQIPVPWKELRRCFLLNVVFLALLLGIKTVTKPPVLVSVLLGIFLYGALLFIFRMVRWEEVKSYLLHWKQSEYRERESESLQP